MIYRFSGDVVKLSQYKIERHFPNLKYKINFEYTSKHTFGEGRIEYNCVAWATGIDDEWIQFPAYDAEGDYEDSVLNYINYFKIMGFEMTDDIILEQGTTKIALYTNEINEFRHVARQLPDGKWASKIGYWEDIEHTTLDALSGPYYGEPKIFMKKKA